MNLPWFRRVGIFFIPISVAGWLTAAGGIVYAIYIFMAIDSKSHSASDTLINFFFNVIIIIAVYSLIAFFTGRSSRR